jgi:filamentous hemagglutinin
VRSVDDLFRAAQAPDRNGLTVAGRALQKHAARQGSAFTTRATTAAALNQAGARIVREILNGPGAARKPNRRGGEDVVAPDGRGVRYDHDGSFYSFLEP